MLLWALLWIELKTERAKASETDFVQQAKRMELQQQLEDERILHAELMLRQKEECEQVKRALQVSLLIIHSHLLMMAPGWLGGAQKRAVGNGKGARYAFPFTSCSALAVNWVVARRSLATQASHLPRSSCPFLAPPTAQHALSETQEELQQQRREMTASFDVQLQQLEAKYKQQADDAVQVILGNGQSRREGGW